VLLVHAPRRPQAAVQPGRELRVSQQRAAHSDVGGEERLRGERFEAHRVAVVERVEPRVLQPEVWVVEQRRDDLRQRVEAERGGVADGAFARRDLRPRLASNPCRSSGRGVYEARVTQRSSRSAFFA